MPGSRVASLVCAREPDMPRGTTLRNFRCDDGRWSLFMQACAKFDTDASTQIREMIDLFLDANDIAPPADSFLYPST